MKFLSKLEFSQAQLIASNLSRGNPAVYASSLRDTLTLMGYIPDKNVWIYNQRLAEVGRVFLLDLLHEHFGKNNTFTL